MNTALLQLIGIALVVAALGLGYCLLQLGSMFASKAANEKAYGENLAEQRRELQVQRLALVLKIQRENGSPKIAELATEGWEVEP